ncbi:MAG: hypothetical protein QF464_08385, partial [Myxococcota bacterium]|nr:hypothetical protein [Myxococcota bacterium]
DARGLSSLYAAGRFRAIVTNPPYGIRFGQHLNFARFYRDILRECWTVLADDTVLLEASPGSQDVWVSGTILAGREGLPRRGDRHRLDHLAVLKPGGPSLSLEPMTTSAAFSAFSQRVFCPVVGGPLPARVIDIVARVAQRVPVFTLASNLTHDVEPLLRRHDGEGV